MNLLSRLLCYLRAVVVSSLVAVIAASWGYLLLSAGTEMEMGGQIPAMAMPSWNLPYARADLGDVHRHDDGHDAANGGANAAASAYRIAKLTRLHWVTIIYKNLHKITGCLNKPFKLRISTHG